MYFEHLSTASPTPYIRQLVSQRAVFSKVYDYNTDLGRDRVAGDLDL